MPTSFVFEPNPHDTFDHPYKEENMKKTYEPPTVQMMAFRYRDQVVAASGGIDPQLDDGTITGDGQWVYDFIRDIWQWIFG